MHDIVNTTTIDAYDDRVRCKARSTETGFYFQSPVHCCVRILTYDREVSGSILELLILRSQIDKNYCFLVWLL